MKCKDIINVLEELCPKSYALDWDNVGLLVGDKDCEVNRVLVALDATDEVVKMAASCNAQMILTHHPMIFSAMKTVTQDNIIGRRILSLARNNIAYYAMHTNFDVCCMADITADIIGMKDAAPLEETAVINGNPAGIGKIGKMPAKSVRWWAEKIKKDFDIPAVTVYGDMDAVVDCVAISPGSGKGMSAYAKRGGAGLLITGDIGHHDGIDSVAMGVNIIDAGHYGLEHVYINYMKDFLNKNLPKLEVETYIPGCPGKII